MQKNTQYIVAIVAALIIAGGAFYGGMTYAKSQVPQRAGGMMGARNGQRFMAGANFISGDVVAKDAQSVTVKLRDGNSRIVFYSTATDVGKFVAGSIDDVAVGKTVMVNGKTNTDGSVTAQSIQIRPAMPQP